MSSITKTKTGVQPLDADDVILADSTSDGELSGVSEGDGPLRQADEAERFTTISGDGPEILRIIIQDTRTIGSKRGMAVAEPSTDNTTIDAVSFP